MRWTAIAVAVSSFLGCAVNRELPTKGDGRSQLSGAIPVPEEFQGSPADFCDRIDLQATALTGIRVGRALVQSQTTPNVESDEEEDEHPHQKSRHHDSNKSSNWWQRVLLYRTAA